MTVGDSSVMHVLCIYRRI